MYLQKEIRKKIIFCWRLEGFLTKIAGAGFGSLVRGMDPGIRIRTKMSRIRNTDCFISVLIWMDPEPVLFQL
jgi:hypothetical protein